MMIRKQLWMMTSGVMAAVALLSACSDSGDGVSGEAAPASVPATRSADPVSAEAATAERVKDALESKLSVDEPRFGSGGKSPCSTASADMFTRKCAAAAKATGEDASFALTQVGGHDGFATLRSVAQKVQKAAATYQELGCATNPSKAATRHACLEPAAVLAQGFPDLRDGANLGLAGK